MTRVVVEKLCKIIKKNIILEDINLTLEGGRIYGLKGQNGCGKTMLMRAICGLIIPDSGSIAINDELLHSDIEFPRSVGALIENPAFLMSYTGYGNLKLLAGLQKGIKNDDIKMALIRACLDPDDKRTYKKYSLGMKQKLGIANAIMGEPDLIILDEPINALDEESVERIKEVLINLRDSGKLIIIACHDKEELEYLSDEVIEMKEGRIIGRKVI